MTTLGIIGVVAAITIPTLLTNIQKHQTVTRLKHTYALLTQAVKLSEAENGELSGWDMTNPTGCTAGSTSRHYESSEAFAKKYIIPYMKYAYECKSNICSSGDVKYLDGTAAAVSSNQSMRLYALKLLNGVTIDFYPRNFLTLVTIDINGPAKPNIIGKDIFYVLIVKDKSEYNSYFGKFPSSGVYMNGDGFSREHLKTKGYPCAKSGHYVGTTCGALIKLDGWKISKDYPW